jgi:adenylate kinase
LRNIILITGTPGVGKSRLARALSKKAGYKIIEPNQLVKREKLYSRLDRRSMTYVVKETRLRKRLEELSRSPAKIVLPTHLVGRAIPKASIKLALVLRLDPMVLFRRLRARGWIRQKALENTEAEILDVCLLQSRSLLGPKRIYEIDTTGKSASSVYREALRALRTPRNGRSGEVNWLAQYDPIDLRRTL